MIDELKIKVLVDDLSLDKRFLTEHGLSIWIEAGEKKILFDTGQGDVLKKNAKAFNIDLSDVNFLVLSHGHYDHVGSVEDVLGLNEDMKIFLHSEIFEDKFSVRKSGVEHIGFSKTAEELLKKRGNLNYTKDPTKLFDGVWLTGEIPRNNDFEDTGGKFYLDKEATKKDSLIDEQALFAESANGIILIVGCAHAGIVNTMDYVSKLTGEKHIYAVIGGMHLLHASRNRLDRTFEALKQYEVQILSPTHCTGMFAVAELKQKFPKEFNLCKAGSLLEI
ncbi:MAG: MBL fold metallo-hydrolase [Verrucomicrobiota bacterium]|nr:MBL fold metallo-hydrolase [Verrucomicrobiota bacterium]